MALGSPLIVHDNDLSPQRIVLHELQAKLLTREAPDLLARVEVEHAAISAKH